jgi:hypothetical protein
MSPPEHALVLAVDEKSQIQALDQTAPCLPMLPTTPVRRTHDYVRHGTTSLFAAYDLASGSVITQHYRRHRHQEFLHFLKLIDTAVPETLGPAPGPGQLRHPQDPSDQGVAVKNPASTCTSPRPAQAGSTSSSAGSPSSPPVSSASPPTTASPTSKATSGSGSTSGIRPRSRSCGPNPPTRSSKPLPPTANGSSTQDTRTIIARWNRTEIVLPRRTTLLQLLPSGRSTCAPEQAQPPSRDRTDLTTHASATIINLAKPRSEHQTV